MTYTSFHTYTVERGLEHYDVEVEFHISSWGSPGQYSGPPERCYPSEPMEGWIIDAWVAASPWAAGRYPHDAMPFALTDLERERIEEHIICNEPPEPPEPDYD